MRLESMSLHISLRLRAIALALRLVKFVQLFRLRASERGRTGLLLSLISRYRSMISTKELVGGSAEPDCSPVVAH